MSLMLSDQKTMDFEVPVAPNVTVPHESTDSGKRLQQCQPTKSKTGKNTGNTAGSKTRESGQPRSGDNSNNGKFAKNRTSRTTKKSNQQQPHDVIPTTSNNTGAKEPIALIKEDDGNGTEEEFQNLLNQLKNDIKPREEPRDIDTEFAELLAQLRNEVKLKEGQLELKRQVRQPEGDAQRRAREAERRAKLEEERARKAREEAERKAKQAVMEERRNKKARLEAARRAKQEEQARKSREEAQRKAREAVIEERRNKKAQLEAEHKAKQAEIAAREANAIVQHIVLEGSAMVTCSAGMEVRDFLCTSDCCYVTVKNLPKDVKAGAVDELFVQQGIERSKFCFLQLRRVADKAEAKIMLEAELGRLVAVGLDGSQFGPDYTLSFVVDEGVALNSMGSSPATQNANVLTISWNLPSLLVVCTYPSPQDARNTVASLNNTIFQARKVRAEIDQGRNKSIPVEASCDVKISGLSPDADLPLVQEHAKATSGIRAIKSPIYDLGQFHQTLKERIQQVGGMDTYDIVSGIDHKQRGNIEEVSVRFITWEQAKKVHDSFEGQRPLGTNSPTLRCRLPKPHQYLISIPFRQYHAQKSRWDALPQSGDNKAAFVQVTVHKNNERAFIRALGEDRKAVGALKVRVENLLSGQTLDGSLWHGSFMSVAGRQFLDNLYPQTTAFVRVDWKSRSLKLYADGPARETAIQLIKTEIERLEALEFSIYIGRTAVGFFMRKGLPALKEELGEDAAMLDLKPTSSKLVIRSGGEAARLIVNRLLEESRNDFLAATKDGEGGSMCPVCFDTPSAPVLLGCGHLYCAACIRHCLTSAVERKEFPLVCVGDEDKCKVPIAIPAIQRLLSVQQFQRLVDAAVASSIERQPDKFKYCATPDCSQVYRCDGDRKSFTCPSCFASVCIACKNVSHEGMTCEEWNLLNDVEEQERRNDQWASSAGAKKCSRCQVFIQKIEGCNRIQCHCGAHICWICLMAFNDAGAAYDHLNGVHGGVFDY